MSFVFVPKTHFKDLIKKISALPKKPKVVAQREIIKSGNLRRDCGGGRESAARNYISA